MKVAISGASGNVGRQLIPLLLAKDVVPLLVGRDPEKLTELFPCCQAISYSEIKTVALGYDVFVHLAALNNNVPATYDVFEQVNVKLSVDACKWAKEAGIGRFVYVSSIHALNHKDHTFYARSKREAAKQLAARTGIDVRVLYLPAVIGDRFSGRLSMLNGLPKSMTGTALAILSALKPTVRAERVAEAILSLGGAGFENEKEVVITDSQRENSAYRTLKRTLDLAVALFLLILFWWLMAIVWALVRLDSPGPGLFKQTRVGRDERRFVLYKFRTMHMSTPQKGTHEISASSVTRLGEFLRRTKLDELPQAINLLTSDMSLVGPRPCLPSQTELISERRGRGVFEIKPGITGLAQMNGIDMSDPERLANWDRRYLDLQGLLLDLRIMMATALGKGSGDRTKR